MLFFAPRYFRRHVFTVMKDRDIRELKPPLKIDSPLHSWVRSNSTLHVHGAEVTEIYSSNLQTLRQAQRQGAVVPSAMSPGLPCMSYNPEGTSGHVRHQNSVDGATH